VAARARRRKLAHYAAPAAFLAAVTIAVLLIRSGLSAGPATTQTTTTVGTVRHTTTASTHKHKHKRKHKPAKPSTAGAQYYTVQSGDTFGTIAAREGITVAQLEQLNPGVSSTSLSVGQRLRVK